MWKSVPLVTKITKKWKKKDRRDPILTKSTKKWKLLEKRGLILDSFLIIFEAENEAEKWVRFKVDFWRIWSDFGVHFGDIFIAFWLNFVHLRKVRFRWPFHTKSMILEAETQWNTVKFEVIFDMPFGSNVWSEIDQKWIKSGSKLDQNLIKNVIKKSMHFRTTLNSNPGWSLEAGREAVGGRGEPIVFNFENL